MSPPLGDRRRQPDYWVRTKLKSSGKGQSAARQSERASEASYRLGHIASCRSRQLADSRHRPCQARRANILCRQSDFLTRSGHNRRTQRPVSRVEMSLSRREWRGNRYSRRATSVAHQLAAGQEGTTMNKSTALQVRSLILTSAAAGALAPSIAHAQGTGTPPNENDGGSEIVVTGDRKSVV